MPGVFKFGIAGGIWASIVGIFYIVLFFSSEGVGIGFGYGASPDLWWLFAIFIVATLAGIASLIGIVQRSKRPLLASILIWVSLAGIFPAYRFMDPVTMGILELPAFGLLFPSAVRIRSPGISAAFISGIAGGIWAIIPGFFAIVGLLLLPHQSGPSSGLMLRHSIFSILVMIMGVLGMAAIYLHQRKPRFALVMMFAGITGIITAFGTLAPDPGGIFVGLPAVILLVPAMIKLLKK